MQINQNPPKKTPLYITIKYKDDLSLYLDNDHINSLDTPDFVVCNVNLFNETFGLDTRYYTELKEIMDILWFETHNNVQPHVAGGLLRRMFNGEKYDDTYDGDIDLFFADTYKESNSNHQESVVEFFCKHLDIELSSDQKEKLDNNRNVVVGKFQVMGEYYDYVESSQSPECCIIHNLKSFDSYCNMAAIHFKSENIIFHKKFMYSNATKHYNFNTYLSNRTHPVALFPRYEKFVKMGYTGTQKDFKHMAEFVANKSDMINKEDHYNDSVDEDVLDDTKTTNGIFHVLADWA